MYKHLYRYILITLLALVMAGGSFVVSMAATAPADADSAAVETAEPTAVLNDSSPSIEDLVTNASGTIEKDTTHWENHTKSMLTEISEEEKPATCTEDGYYKKTVHCGACNNLLVQKIVYPALGHTESEPELHTVDATCTEEGHIYSVITCTVCGEELSREEVEILPALGHVHGEPVEENRVEPTDTEDGSYDNVVYCAVCGEELSRETIVLPATGEIVEPEPVEPVDPTDPANPTDPASPTDPAGPTDPANPTDPAGPTNPVDSADPVTPGKPHEEIIVIEPVYVSITDGYDTYLGEVDENGTAEIYGLLTILDKNSNASETLTMDFGGKSYTFTRYADGSVSGLLPKGFEIKGDVLIIKGVSGSMDISVSEHTAMSSIAYAYEPAPGVEEYVEGSYYEPVAEPASTASGSSRRSSGYGAHDGSMNAYAASLLEDVTGANAEDADKDEAAKTEVKTETIKPAPSAGTTSEVQGEYRDDSSNLLIFANLALVSGLIVGLGVLWRLGVFSRS